MAAYAGSSSAYPSSTCEVDPVPGPDPDPEPNDDVGEREKKIKERREILEKPVVKVL